MARTAFGWAVLLTVTLIEMFRVADPFDGPAAVSCISTTLFGVYTTDDAFVAARDGPGCGDLTVSPTGVALLVLFLNQMGILVADAPVLVDIDPCGMGVYNCFGV